MNIIIFWILCYIFGLVLRIYILKRNKPMTRLKEKKHKHQFYMDRGTCFCRISGCGEFHTTCFTGHPLTDKHKEKCNCGSWPDPHWTENDYRRKEEAKKKCPIHKDSSIWEKDNL